MAHSHLTRFSDSTPPNEEGPDLKLVEGFDEPRTPRKIPKFVKLLAGTAIGLVVVAGVAGFAATQFIDQAKYKKLAVDAALEKTGYTIDWKGDIGLSLLPMPHVTVNDLQVSNGAQQVLTVKSASVDVALLPLLSKQVDIRKVSIDEPVVTLVTSKNGQATWMTDKLQSEDSSATASGASGETSAEQPMNIMVKNIDVSGGTLVWDDLSSGSKQTIEKLDLHADADSLQGPFDIDSSFDWSGHSFNVKATSGQTDGKGHQVPLTASIKDSKSDLEADFSGSLDTTDGVKANGDVNVQIGDLADTIKSFTGSAPELPKGLDGKLNLAGKLVYTPERTALDNMMLQLGALEYSGGFAIENKGGNAAPVLSFALKPEGNGADRGDQLISTLAGLTVSGKGSVNGNKINIEQANLKAQGNDVDLKGSVTTGGAVPVLDMNISARRLDLDGLQKNLGTAATGGEGKSSPAKSESSGVDGFSLPFTGHVVASIGQLITGGKTYSNINADVRADKNTLTIASLKAGLPADTSVSVKGKIGNTQDLSGMDVAVSGNTGDVKKLAQAYMATPPEIPAEINALSMNGHFTGSLKQLGFNTTADIKGLAVTGEGQVKDVMSAPVINSLNFNVKHASFSDAVRLVSPDFDRGHAISGPLNLSGQVQWDKDVYQLSGLKGALGTTTLDGDVSVDMATKPRITGNLTFGDVVLPKSAAAKARTQVAASGGTPSSQGRWSRDAIDTSPLRDFDADVKISARSITQNLWVLTNARLDARLKEGTLKINDLSAKMFGGQASMQGTVAAGAGQNDPLSVNADISASDVNAQSVVSAVMGVPSDTVKGTLTKMDVTLNAAGASQSALVQTLAGKGSLSGKNIIVKGVDAAQLGMAAKGSYKPLERAGTLFDSFGNGQTEFTDFDAAFVIENGIANFSKIYFDGPKAALSSTGDINLPQWTINLKNTMTIKDTDIPPFDFTVKGPLDNPTKAGGNVIDNYLRGKLEKKVNKLIGNELNKLLGVEPTKEAVPPATTDEGAAAGDAVAPATPEAAPANSKEQKAQEAVKALQGLFGR